MLTTEIGATRNRSAPRRILAYMMLAVVAAAVAVVVALRTFVSSSPSHALRVAGDPTLDAGGIVKNVPLHTSYVYIVGPVCVTSGHARITKITTVDQRGSFSIVGWAVSNPGHQVARPLTDGVAGTAEKLPGFNHDPVTAHCADKYGFTRLAVTVQIGSQAAATNNLRIHYTASDGSGSLVERFTITECTTPTCPRLAYNAPPGDS